MVKKEQTVDKIIDLFDSSFPLHGYSGEQMADLRIGLERMKKPQLRMILFFAKIAAHGGSNARSLPR